MSSFAGVSVITEGKLSTTSAIDAGADSGYHLLVVKDYSRTVQEVPSGKSIKVGPFMVGGHKWRIWYYPNGDPWCSDFISLYLGCVDDNDEMEEAVEAKFEFSFVDQVERQKPMHVRATEICSFYSKGPRRGLPKFVRGDKLEQSAYLKDDCFTIRCDIIVCNDLNTQDAGGTLSEIGQHFKILLQDKVGSDVTFEVSGETFPAHRCMLAARSKVFKAQFFGPMAEGITSGVIQIKDMEAKVFAALLSFIYTDSFPEMEKDNLEEEEGQDEEEADNIGMAEIEEGQDEEEADNIEMPEIEEEGQEEEATNPVTWLQWLQDLFVAADRYDIQQLKFLCEKKLSEHIDVSFVASSLALAEQHHCHGLKEACLKFIQVQSPFCLDKVMATDGWEHLIRMYPSVLKEIITKIASNQNNDKKRKR